MNSKPEIIGDVSVHVSIPSITKELKAIPPKLIEEASHEARLCLSKLFGGTLEPREYVGSYRHTEDGALRHKIVEEVIIQIEAGTTNENLRKKGKEKELIDLCNSLKKKLDQEAIMYKWGNLYKYVLGNNKENDVVQSGFHELSKEFQKKYIFLAYRQLSNIDEIFELFKLNGWEEIEVNQENEDLNLVGENPEKKFRFLIAKDLNPNNDFEENDIIVSKYNNGVNFRYYSKTLLGPIWIPFSYANHQNSTRSPIEQLLSLILCDRKEIVQWMNKKDVTWKFFKEYKKIFNEICKVYLKEGFTENKSSSQAQLTLSRLLIARFLEEKHWLEDIRNTLSENHKKKISYHESLNNIYFDILDNVESNKYLNGGIFEKNEMDSVELPTELFDINNKNGIFNLIYKYDFTIDYFSNTPDPLSIDSSMLGHVLECLSDQIERKSKGTTYTPNYISSTLASTGLIYLLAEKSNIEIEKLNKFYFESNESILTKEEAKYLHNQVRKLKILDPAVGSGSLLFSCLDFLLSITSLCKERLGSKPRLGSDDWYEEAKYIVENVLYGVDIDETAIEITRLRLWLKLVIQSEEPIALPLLNSNIQKGDALSKLELPEELEKLIQVQRELKLSSDYSARLDSCIENFGNIHTKLNSANAQDKRFLSKQLIETERELLETYNDENEEKLDLSLSDFLVWKIRFFKIFKKNKGFDFIIANPPYIRPQLLKDNKRTYPHLNSFAGYNRDLYLGFIEQSLNLLNKKGHLAFIMPNFNRQEGGIDMKNFLIKNHHVNLWVDFRDNQVFENVSNYVSLMFLKKKKSGTGKQKQIEWKEINRKIWSELDQQKLNITDTPINWISGIPSYFTENNAPWLMLNEKKYNYFNKLKQNTEKLSKHFNVSLGVQTSKDEFYLLEHRKIEDGLIVGYSKILKEEIKIENEILFECAKGSPDIKHFELVNLRWILWPYDKNGNILSLETI